MHLWKQFPPSVIKAFHLNSSKLLLEEGGLLLRSSSKQDTCYFYKAPPSIENSTSSKYCKKTKKRNSKEDSICFSCTAVLKTVAYFPSQCALYVKKAGHLVSTVRFITSSVFFFKFKYVKSRHNYYWILTFPFQARQNLIINFSFKSLEGRVRNQY